MEKSEHAKLLRAAMTERGLRARAVADFVGVSSRTVGNWISRSAPTMPGIEDRAALRRLFPGYDQDGDPVEVALRASELHEWRQDAVLSVYKRNLHEQREERAG